jgi:hypothetical protein
MAAFSSTDKAVIFCINIQSGRNSAQIFQVFLGFFPDFWRYYGGMHFDKLFIFCWLAIAKANRKETHPPGGGRFRLGDAHTNTIEGFWSLVKMGIGGVYHSAIKKYLQTYLDEYSFRYNRRMAGQPMFTSLLGQVSERAE